MKKLVGFGIIALLLATSALAMKNEGTLTATPKYAPPSWGTTGSHRCEFRTNTYPDGSTHTIWGVLGRKSNGSSICFIPTFGGRLKRK